MKEEHGLSSSFQDRREGVRAPLNKIFSPLPPARAKGLKFTTRATYLGPVPLWRLWAFTSSFHRSHRRRTWRRFTMSSTMTD